MKHFKTIADVINAIGQGMYFYPYIGKSKLSRISFVEKDELVLYFHNNRAGNFSFIVHGIDNVVNVLNKCFCENAKALFTRISEDLKDENRTSITVMCTRKYTHSAFGLEYDEKRRAYVEAVCKKLSK